MTNDNTPAKTTCLHKNKNKDIYMYRIEYNQTPHVPLSNLHSFNQIPAWTIFNSCVKS